MARIGDVGWRVWEFGGFRVAGIGEDEGGGWGEGSHWDGGFGRLCHLFRLLIVLLLEMVVFVLGKKVGSFGGFAGEEGGVETGSRRDQRA